MLKSPAILISYIMHTSFTTHESKNLALLECLYRGNKIGNQKREGPDPPPPDLPLHIAGIRRVMGNTL